MEPLKTKRAKDGSKDFEVTERLSLRKEEQEKLERWVSELNAKFDGMIRLTKSDLANFLIRHHENQLNAEEIASIETEHFDEVRWINWALVKIREAKRLGQSLTLEELMVARKPPVQSLTKRGRKSRKADESKPDQDSINAETQTIDKVDIKPPV